MFKIETSIGDEPLFDPDKQKISKKQTVPCSLQRTLKSKNSNASNGQTLAETQPLFQGDETLNYSSYIHSSMPQEL